MTATICALWLAFTAYRILCNAIAAYNPYARHELISSIGGALLVWVLLGWAPVGLFLFLRGLFL